MMVKNKLRDSTNQTIGIDSECLICLKTIKYDHYAAEISEILTDLFEVLCKYMEWSPPLKYHFNFKNETFPFCKECKSTLVTLYKSHQMLGEVQKQITSLISTLCGKILLSEWDEKACVKNKLSDSSQNGSLSEEILPKSHDKINFYRDLIDRRYSASVRVTLYSQSIVVHSTKVLNEQINSGVPDDREEVNEIADYELADAESTCTETTETSSCIQETKKDGTHEKIEKAKRIVRCDEGSELLILNYRRIPKRIVEEKKDLEESTQQLSHDEVSSEYSQTEDSDYEPNISSQKNCLPDNDSDKSEEITEPSGDEVKERAKFVTTRGKFHDRVRTVAKNKYSFDGKYKFKFNSDGKWVCSSCNHPYHQKSSLLDHLAKTCKGPRNVATKKRIQELESETDCSDVNEDADSSDYENVREFPLPQCFTGELPIRPLFIRRRKIRPKRQSDTEVSVRKDTEGLAKTPDELPNQRPGLKVQSNDSLEENGNDLVTQSSSEGIDKILPNTTSISSSLNSPNQNIVVDKPTSENMNESVTEEFQIRMECNIFESATYENRIQKIGPSQYVLDNKHSFEFLDNEWKCIACKFVCDNKNSLKQHFDRCLGSPPVDSVETITFQKWTYDKLKNGKFQCRHCKHISSSNDDTKIHMKRCHKFLLEKRRGLSWIELELNKFLCNDKYPFERMKDKFKCGTCSETTSPSIREILKHIQSKHIPDPGKKKLNVKSIQPDKFIVNEKFSFEKVPDADEYRCCECIYSCRTLFTIKNHILEKHIDPEKFSCGTCGKRFARKYRLTHHEATHRTDRPFVCEVCGKTFKTKLSLETHKDKDSTHLESSDKNFSCNICDRAFSLKSSLVAHTKTHERVICDVCGKGFPRANLKVHLEAHSEVNNYECHKCGKKYRRYNSLCVHLKSHDGVKPYSCNICGMKFTQQYNVIRHKNVVHNPNKTTKTYEKTRKRKRKEDSSEDEKTDDEEMSNEEELPEEEISDEEKSTRQVSEEED